MAEPVDAGTRFAERRAVPRYPFIASVEVVEPITQTKLTGRTAEIGLHGCYIDALNPLPAKTVIQLRIQRDIGRFETWGRVAYSQEGFGMGIAFFQTVEEQKKILQNWILELASSQVS